jgi:surface carbohydrate biosynthesis protein
MKLSSVVPALRVLWKAKKVWTAPARAPILVFDRNGSEVFRPYLPTEPAILEVRGESINVRVLLATVLKNGFRTTMGTYTQEYVRFVKPRIALTHIDNALHFYRLKESQPELVTISVQNGIRDNVLFEILARANGRLPLRADHILCFGRAVGEKYAEHIDASIHPIGSFMNNSVPRNVPPTKGHSVMFLSQFRVPHLSWKEPVMPVGEKLIEWNVFYRPETTLLPALLAYCRQRNLPFSVCGCSIEDREKEESFFRGLLGDTGWEYLPRISLDASYRRIDQVRCVVFVDSTIGYEALARGARAAVFSLRGTATQSEDRGFGLSVRHPPTGPFWTTVSDPAEVDRVLDYVLDATDGEWEAVRSAHMAEIMAFDPDNSRFRALLAALGFTRESKH